MLKQYSNIEQINSAKKAIEAKRFLPEDLGVFQKTRYQYQSIELTNENSSNELHVYSGGQWITGCQKIDLTNYSDPIYDKDGNEIQLTSPVSFNIEQELLKLKLTSGNFKIVVNFFENIIGSYNNQHLAIDEISPDRTELRLKAINERNPAFLLSINNYINNVQQTSLTNDPYNCYLLNFSRNKTIKYVNSVVVGKYLFVKLYKPIDKSYKKNLKLWIVREKKNPYVDNIQITEKVIPTKFNIMQGTNWYASAEQETSNETSFKTWNELLGSSLQTSQQIIDNYFSGSLGGIKINIDYTDFNNFIFYSSATERLDNFKYKLELLEHYLQQSESISQISGPAAVNNAIENKTLYTNLISGLDDFEKFLFHESSSGLFNNEIPLTNPTVAEVTGSYITPIPKQNSTRPYQQYSVTSSIFEQWYNDLHEKAELYDLRNNNKILQAVPKFMLLDESGVQLSTFVNMLGQHYDVLYTYINKMTSISSRDEHPKLGMPNELLYTVAKQFGWKLTNGSQSEDLWKYTLGTDEFGVPLTGSNSVGDAAVPLQDVTFNIWRRIVNNIPGLLKTKGTKRGIQALLACYGIPQSLITIQEYGGPRIKRPPRYEKYNFDYALDLIANPAGTIEVSYDSSVNSGIVKSAQLRFRTDNVLTNPSMPTTMNLFTVGGHDVTITFVRGTIGTIDINGTQSDEIELFDGGYTTALLRQDGSNLEILAKRSKYGKIVATVSASVAGTFALPSATANAKMIIGGTGGGSRLQGQVQELRLWSSSLADAPFTNHTKAPSAYDGNEDAYAELIFRTPLTQKINHAETASIGGVQPNQFLNTITADFSGWTNDTPYDSVEETYFFDGVSLGAGTFDDNKIRIESQVTQSMLNTENRVSLNEFDSAPLDSEQLGVFYSPQTMINEDIIAQLGFTILDDLIGDPSNIDPYAYPDLVNTSRDYWKKYTDRNDMNAYIRIFSLFDLSFFKQVEQILPARADKTVGVLVQPNILERSRDKVLTRVSKESLTFTGSIDLDNDEIEGETKQLEPIVDVLPPITSSTLQLEPIIDIEHELISGSTRQLEQSIDISLTELTGSRNDFTGTLDAFNPEEYLSGSRNEYSQTLDVFNPEGIVSGSTKQLESIIIPEEIFEVTASSKDIEAILQKEQKIIEADRRSYNSVIDANRNPFEGSIYSRQYLLFNKETEQYITGSTPYWESEAISPFITSSRLSEFKQIRYELPRSVSYDEIFNDSSIFPYTTIFWQEGQSSISTATYAVASASINLADDTGSLLQNQNKMPAIFAGGILTKQQFNRSDEFTVTHEVETMDTQFGSRTYVAGLVAEDDGDDYDDYPTMLNGFGGRMKYGFMKYTNKIRVLAYETNGGLIPSGYVDMFTVETSSAGALSNGGDVVTAIFKVKPNGGASVQFLKNGVVPIGTGVTSSYDWGTQGTETKLGYQVTNAGQESSNPADWNTGNLVYGMKERYFSVSDKVAKDFKILKTPNIEEQPRADGMGFRNSDPTPNNQWDAAIMGEQVFERGDTPILNVRVKVANISGTDAPRPILGWYPSNTVNNNGFITSTTYSTNEYAVYISTDDVFLYHKGSSIYSGGAVPGAAALNVLAIKDILDIQIQVTSVGAYFCVKRTPEIGTTTTIINYNYIDPTGPLENELRFGSHFWRKGKLAHIFESINITTGKSLKGFEYRPAEYQDYSPRGIANSRFEGTKISSPDFNINSKDTPDGKPVVEITETDGTKVIVTKSPGTEGNFEVR